YVRHYLTLTSIHYSELQSFPTRRSSDLIKYTINELKIDCELSNQDAYLYATTEEYAQKVKKEYEAYQALGIDGELVDTIPLNLEIKNAVMMRDQAQFHPVKYL